MNSKNEQYFYKRLNIQVCELLQVLTEAAIKRCFEKYVLRYVNISPFFYCIAFKNVMNTLH